MRSLTQFDCFVLGWIASSLSTLLFYALLEFFLG